MGHWYAVGQSFASNKDPTHPRGAAEPWVSDELTEWHAGKFFVVQHEDAMAGSASLITHAVIGYDGASGDYIAHAFENHGRDRRYGVRVVERAWTFTRDTEARVAEKGTPSTAFATSAVALSQDVECLAESGACGKRCHGWPWWPWPW